MASSYREPAGYRRTDPDETEGRLLYRQIAEAEARRSIAQARPVRLLNVGDAKLSSTADASARQGINQKDIAPAPEEET